MGITEEKLQIYLKEIEKNNKTGKKINAILHLNSKAQEEAKIIDEKIKARKAGKLAGKIIAIKSNINVKGLITNCGSKTLENYYAGYDATVVKKIKREDGLIIGMCNQDEFACGSSGETSAFGLCKNPTALNLIPGGSSSGSAASVAADFCDIALGSDTGGSVRNPASHCGVIGIKPTYGLVSRYGLIDLSMSLDQISPITKNINDAVLILNIIKGKDANDSTTFSSNEIKLERLKNIKIAIADVKCDKEIFNLVSRKIEEVAKKSKWKIDKVKLRYIDLAVQTYYPICYTEFYSGTRKFDGRKYGKKIEDSCGEEVLRRILGGQEICQAEHHGKYYRQALKVKGLITKEFEKIFEKYDAIILPTVPKLPHKLGSKVSVEDMYAYDAMTIPANLAQIPAISIPAGKIKDIPVGLQIMCARFNEGKMFSIAKEFEYRK